MLDVGPQYVLCLAVWCLALLLVRTSLRGRSADLRHRLLTAGFAAGLTRELFNLGMEFLGPRPMRPHLLLPGVLPAIDAWVQGAAVIVLIAGFLAYQASQPTIGWRYVKIAFPLHSGASLAVIAMFVALPGLTIFGLRRDMIVAGLVSLSFSAMAAGLALALRCVPRDPERWILTAGIACFLGSVVVRGLAYLQVVPSLRPPVDIPYSVTTSAIGVVLLGYLFVRTHSAHVRADMSVLEELVRQRTAHLESALEELAVANSLLVEQSTIDSLTGAYNRRYFDETLATEWARAIREGHSLALALVDIDEFKAINDQFGHPKGDECLLYIAGVLQGRLRRPGDVVARYGGDEFAVLLPCAGEFAAAETLDAIRRQIQDHADAPASGLTVSIGVAACAPQAGADPAELLQRADQRLYEAKQAGRNCVRVGVSTAAAIARG